MGVQPLAKKPCVTVWFYMLEHFLRAAYLGIELELNEVTACGSDLFRTELEAAVANSDNMHSLSTGHSSERKKRRGELKFHYRREDQDSSRLERFVRRGCVKIENAITRNPVLAFKIKTLPS